jgi:hypothetical protein
MNPAILVPVVRATARSATVTHLDSSSLPSNVRTARPIPRRIEQSIQNLQEKVRAPLALLFPRGATRLKYDTQTTE